MSILISPYDFKGTAIVTQPMAWVFGGAICLSEQWKTLFRKCVSLFFTIAFGNASGTEITYFTLAFPEQQNVPLGL